PAGATVDELVDSNALFQRMWRDPVLGPELRARYQEALQTQIPVADLVATYDGMVAAIAPSAHRDERRWRDLYLGYDLWADRTDFTDFDAESAYLREWI